MFRFLTLVCLAVLAMSAPRASATRTNIVYNLKNGNSINVRTEEHFRGEYDNEAASPGTTEPLGYAFFAPLTIYIDANHQLTNGTTEETTKKGSLSRVTLRLARPDGTILDRDRAGAFADYSFGSAFDYTGGTVTWYYDLADLPDNAITVVSTFGATKVTPNTGTIFRDDNTLMQFSAPEFVYLNRDFGELAGPGNVDDSESTRAYYRVRNLGYAIDGESVQGVERFFERTITRNIKVIWQWELEFSVYIVSATGTAGENDAGFGDPDPAIGRHWVKGGTTFTASIDSDIESEEAGFRVRSKGYKVRNRLGTVLETKVLNPQDSRVATDPITISDPKIIEWDWDGQWRYRLDAKGGQPGESPSAFDGQAFVRVDGVTHFGRGGETDIWIDAGKTAKVGAFYRTADRCFTLDDFGVSPGGDLANLGVNLLADDDISALGDENVVDQSSTVRLARVRNVTVAAPTEIRWQYKPTVFRAEFPLGQALGVVTPNALLVPDLCVGAVLSDSGPLELITPMDPTPTGSENGAQLRWDQVGKMLYPVHPGNYRIEWPDANDRGKTYTIEIVSHYPGENEVEVPSERELSNGSRRTTTTKTRIPRIDANGNHVGAPGAPQYYTLTTNLGGAGVEFPAAPNAHYRHLFDEVVDRRPPTKLDLNASDEWNFLERTYTDLGTDAEVDEGPGKTFTTKGEGRSVLLYSRRPNRDEVADGTLEKEELRVRVVQSSKIEALRTTDPKFVLGQRGLELGGNTDRSDGAFGAIFHGGFSAGFNTGPQFVIDYWLNTSGLRPDDGPVTILATGDDKLTVTLDAATSTITANYLGMEVTRPFSTAGATWKHHIIHGFTDEFFGIGGTFLNFYIDGKRRENAQVTTSLATTGTPYGIVTADITNRSLRLGAGANPLSRLQLDELRIYGISASNRADRWLTPAELLELRSNRLARPSNTAPLLQCSFESAPTVLTPPNAAFPSAGFLANIGIGPVPPEPTNPQPELPGQFAGSWAHVDIQEVATRIDGTLDQAGFGGSGYILNKVSNYNADIYDREAEVGTWGPIYPVNHGSLYLDNLRRLEVAYYENWFLIDPEEHPDVAWPYEAARYDKVKLPTFGPHRDKAVYLASRVGSEGVDRNGRPQEVFDLENYSDLKIYNQPDRTLPGLNYNEEHALVAPSNRAALKIKDLGGELPNNPPLAAFALQHDIKVPDANYPFDPWVLVQVNNLRTGEPEMAAYQVLKFRVGNIHFPRPSDQTVNELDENGEDNGLAYESAPLPENRFLTIDRDKAYKFSYDFSYPVFAGDLLIPPYPLNLVVGNTPMLDDRGSNTAKQQTLWRDVNGHAWVVSGDGRFLDRFHYPFRSDFYMPTTVNPGTPVAWVPESENGRRRFVGDDLVPHPVIYTSFWRTSYPKLKRGETLTYQGGEYFNENPGSNGLPALVAMKATEIVFDSGTPTMILNEADLANQSARIIRALDRHESRFTVAKMDAAKFSPASTKIFVMAERWYFKDLPGSLQRRFYFDSLAEKLVFRGYLNDKDSGDPDLTAGPDPINILEPNVITADDLKRLRALAESQDWQDAITEIHKKSQNPTRARKETTQGGREITGSYLAGMKEAPTLTQRIGLNEQLFPAQQDLSVEKSKLQVLADRVEELEDRRSSTWSLNYSEYSGQIAAAKDEHFFFDRRRIRQLEEEVGSYELKIQSLPTQTVSSVAHLNSFGVGSALVCNPNLLTSPVDGSRYITIAENNRQELDGAPVSLHIIEIVPDRFRGAIKVIEAADAFSEKITLQHNGDFGANTGKLYYEWWIRDAGPLDVVAEEVFADGTLKEVDERGQSLWQQYIPLDRASETNEEKKHLGLHTVVFEGRPDVTLADKLVLMRYRHKDETGWNLVPFEFTNPVAEWQPGAPAPFQWAGAANSPQLQADGSKRYIPQLVMGWVKRILDRINPYEARYTDFFSNESPAVYSSQIQIAGAPFAGKVALNPDKNVIENTGLIELYETVLARARELSIDNSSNAVSTDGIGQALLLAATRLAVLYELLAREAYSDAQDSTITVTDASDLASVASFTHAFQNFEASLQHEELALLRGTDFRKSYPVYNRMFWNYAKGLGEAAYNVNYNIYDENTDGFINEDDARALYPQGHGDAWGHFVSALGMHYTLLQHPVFSWRTRSELYSLMQNVLEVDFLDEKTFAKLAAGKARAGRDIVRGTYRLHYTQEPDGQWQGYTDGADPARAWGVSEWATRTGQAAYFDWAVANSLVPDDAGAATPINNPENLDRIERLGALDEIGEIAGGLYEIQIAMDEANGGVNPLGFDSDALAFDLDPSLLDGTELNRETHFEQLYQRALVASNNALATLDFSSKVGNKLMRLADKSDAMIVEAFRQDLDYRNRLIEIFGRPYDGTIGFGKVFPEGYEGPDTQLFAYLDRTTITQIIPKSGAEGEPTDVTYQSTLTRARGLADNTEMEGLYGDIFGSFFENIGVVFSSVGDNFLGVGEAELKHAFLTLSGTNTYEDFTEVVGEEEIPVRKRSPYAFQAEAGWGQRTSYGKVQRILEEELRERIALDSAIADYVALIQDLEAVTNRIEGDLALSDARDDIHLQITLLKKQLQIVKITSQALIGAAKFFGLITKDAANAAAAFLPTSAGFSVDIGAPGRGAAKISSLTATTAANATNLTARKVFQVAEFAAGLIVGELERDLEKTDELAEIEGFLVELVALTGKETPLRNAIGTHLQNLELKQQEYLTAQAEGFRLLREREGFNKILAAKTQKDRYQDMIFRIARNEAMTKYQSAFNHAARYAWMAARAYEYETSLDPGDPAAAGALLDQIVKERQLGLWTDGQPQAGQGGLAEILNHLNGNFQVLKGQLGLNNPQSEREKISLRSELFRIGPGLADGGTAASDDRWKDALKARIVPDLNQIPEFRRYCRPFAAGVQPGIVIRFPTSIEPGRNVFGLPLIAGDHNYSTANFATKIRGFGAWLENYNAAGLSTTPRAYLVPVGNDYMRHSSSAEPATRIWSVQEQRIPTPFVINEADLKSPGFIPTLNGVDGGFSELRRHGDFRMYHDAGGAVNESELILASRLIGRSVWNSEWLLIIPGAGLHVDPDTGLRQLADTVSDLKLHFSTYSHQGQ